MLARFFIDRPVLAWVISVVIVLLGAIAAGFLPVAEYPEIQPPTVRVTANYPGANASLFYTSQPSRIFAPGPKQSHAQARSYMRCRPIQSVCTPGSLCGRSI